MTEKTRALFNAAARIGDAVLLLHIHGYDEFRVEANALHSKLLEAVKDAVEEDGKRGYRL